MPNEHLNPPVNENAATTDSPSAKETEKPPRSKLERAVVWTLIGLLLIFTAMEGLSQYGYNNTLEDFETAIANAPEPVTLDKFHNGIRKGLPIKTTGVREGRSTILYKWPSLLRQYEIHFTVSGDEEFLETYSTGDGPAAMIRPIQGDNSPQGDEMLDGAMSDGTMPSGPSGPGEPVEEGPEPEGSTKPEPEGGTEPAPTTETEGAPRPE